VEPFKYISDIISKFSPAQRILALLLLLLTITIISVTPVIVNAVTTNEEECTANITRLESRLRSVEGQNDTLALMVRNGRMECTNAIAQREAEFVKMLDTLQKDINRDANRSGIHYANVVSEMMVEGVGSGEPAAYNPPVVESYTKVDNVMKRIEKMKKNIQK